MKSPYSPLHPNRQVDHPGLHWPSRGGPSPHVGDHPQRPPPSSGASHASPHSTSSTDQGDMTSQYSTAWLVSPCRPTGWGLSTSSHELVLGDHDDVDPPLL